MIRWLQFLSVVAAAAGAVAVFQIKYQAEAVAERAAELQRDLDSEKEALSLLKAEWSYLGQPARVQEIVEKHQDTLKLAPLSSEQITRFETLPTRQIGPEPDDEAALSDLLSADPTATGSLPNPASPNGIR